MFQENPYVMLRQNHQELEGNDRYEGFCVDMLKELADILKFKYRIRLVADGVYGVPGANGTWTGMVGELISRVNVHTCTDNSKLSCVFSLVSTVVIWSISTQTQKQDQSAQSSFSSQLALSLSVMNSVIHSAVDLFIVSSFYKQSQLVGACGGISTVRRKTWARLFEAVKEQFVPVKRNKKKMTETGHINSW